MRERRSKHRKASLPVCIHDISVYSDCAMCDAINYDSEIEIQQDIQIAGDTSLTIFSCPHCGGGIPIVAVIEAKIDGETPSGE